MDSKTISSSAKEVRNRTRVSSCDLRSCRHASNPLPSGNRTSMSTTSGCRRAASSTAAAAVPASPTTSMPAWRLNKVCSPRRTTLWSSTISKRINLDSSSLIKPAGGHLNQEARALARRGKDFAARADFVRPRGDVPQAVAAARGGLLFKARSIVLDLQPHALVLFFQGNNRALRPGVPQTVAHGFARDLKQVRRLARAQRFGGLRVDVERELPRLRLAHGRDQGLQSGFKLASFQCLGLQADDEIAQ